METVNPNQSPDSSENPVQTRTVLNQANNQRGFFPIILGVLILLIVVGAGVYYLGIQNDKTIIKNKDIQPKTNIQNTVTGASEASDISVVTRDPQIFTIDNWKVHMDDEYRITISYPPNWSVSSYTKNETEVPRILLVNGGTSLFFYPYSNPDAGECPVKVIKKEDIKVGDEIISFGYYITRNTTQLSACADLNASSPVGKKFRNINFLLTSYKDAEEVDMKIVKQILSTFKSTN